VKRTFERRKIILPPVPAVFTDVFPALPEKLQGLGDNQPGY
jgi:hypothetical protein